MEVAAGLGWFAAGIACGALVVAPMGFKTVAALLRQIEGDLHPERRREGST